MKWLSNLLGWKTEAPAEPPTTRPASVADVVREAEPPPAPVADPAREVPPSEPTPEPEPEAVELEDPPWDLSVAATSLDVKENRDRAVEVLTAHIDDGSSSAERTFLESLIRTLNQDKIDLPAFPDVARELDSLLRSGEPTMNQVVRLVEREPALVQRVWVRASSAEFDSPPKGLHFAISRLGFDDLWRIAIQVCLHSELFRVPGFQAQADQVRDHGMVAADVAADLGGERRGPLYVAGLLHDVGKLIVYRHATVGLLYSAKSPSLLEQVLHGLHANIGVLVARSWSLNDEVAAALAFHHAPLTAQPEVQRHVWLTRVADVAVHQVDAEKRKRKFKPSSALDGCPPELHRGKDPLVVARRAFEDYKKQGV